MEKDVSSSYSCPIQRRPVGEPPVLHVKVLYGLLNEETAYSSPTGGLGSSSSSSPTGANALGRAGVVCPAAVAGTQRAANESLSGLRSFPGSSAANGTGAVPSSPLAKPVLDLAQVRCIPMDQWVPDAHVVNCMAPGCNNSFSLFNRKHHCRMCGRVFCSSCCNNVVYISASVLNNATNGSAEGVAMGSHAFRKTSEYLPTVASELIQPHCAGSSDDSALSNGVRRRGESPVPPSTHLPARTGTVTFPGSLTSSREGNGSMPPNAITTTSAMTAAPSSSFPSTQASVACRVCASCSYEVQLVVSTRQENGEARRRSRGELKMLQRVLLVNVMTFLTLRDLASVSLVSADFYFMSRDNIIWYQYNMTRWMKESELLRFDSLTSRVQPHRSGSRYSSLGTAARSASFADGIFSSKSVIPDATALSMSEAAKRVISLHARYSYTQFLDFVRRQEMARCEGISSFSLGARILLSSPIRLALVGPCGIGKTASVRTFLGEKPSQMVVRPTIGFERRAITVRLAGALSTEVTLHIYDLSGADRYEKLRRFVCRHCHVIGLCYDPSRKVTLVQAADIMMELEGALSAQPVVVCGLVRQQKHLAGSESVPPGRHKASLGGRPTEAGAPVAAAAVGLDLSATPQRKEQHPQHLPSGIAAPERAGGVPDEQILVAPPSGALNGSNRPPKTSISAASATVTRLDGASEINDDEGSSSLRVSEANLSMSSSCRNILRSSLSGSALPVPTTASAHNGGLEVSAEDAVGITVRGHSSIQCPLLKPTPFFEVAVQAVFDRLMGATVASTSTIFEISEELMMSGNGSVETSTGHFMTSRSAGSPPASAMRVPSLHRRSRASRAIVQDLLNLTMQPCALDILLDTK
ncbi:hypothetical protein JKF63_06764 [Porcisia hertigi]|uniref:FYVE-type domain-containing protein n=1 Tax=Porcisia hertigi TaxID=2761500 RepID=A0A836IH65_9TRYP|nr:hypothetical protein JKF63_06764 [Porcisia hertigi]